MSALRRFPWIPPPKDCSAPWTAKPPSGGRNCQTGPGAIGARRLGPPHFWPGRTCATPVRPGSGSATTETSCSPSLPRQTRHTRKLQADQYARSLQRESLRVVVLGPGEAQPQDLRKRRQIASRLRETGYSLAKLGEELLQESETPLHLALLSELPNIDLLLVLNTGVAPLAELVAISLYQRGRQITRVWSKREFTEGRRSTPSDVVQMFDNWSFSQEEFESCELVESVVAIANEFYTAQLEGRLTGLGLLPPD